MNMYKQDLAFNNLQWLICYKTKLYNSPNFLVKSFAFSYVFVFRLYTLSFIFLNFFINLSKQRFFSYLIFHFDTPYFLLCYFFPDPLFF